tara:strand:- start:373 stop:747 length:375 start_codon:yes stop_codon:yes gene_type:complete
MALTQSEAVATLVMEMGFADGDYSDQEIESVVYNNPVYLKYQQNIDHDLFLQKIKRGETTKQAAVSTLKNRSLDTQLNALACVWHCLLADGKMTEGEKSLMVELLVDFDIHIDDVTARLKKITS